LLLKKWLGNFFVVNIILKQTTFMELKMGLKAVIVFVVIVGIAFLIYKIIEKTDGSK